MSTRSASSVKVYPVFNNINGLALRLKIGPCIQLTKKPEHNKLNPHKKQKCRQYQERIPIHAEIIKYFHIQGHGSRTCASQYCINPPLAKQLNRFGGVGHQKLYRHQVEYNSQGPRN